MNNLPENVKKKLENYLFYLDGAIEREKYFLEQIKPKGGIRTLEQADTYRPMIEPIVRSITAYGDARSEICRLFPELEKKG